MLDPDQSSSQMDFDQHQSSTSKSLKTTASFGKFAEHCQKHYKSYAERATFETFDSFTALFLVLFGIIIILPTALSFWMIFHFFNNDGGVTSPVRWLLAIALPLYISIWGIKKKSLSYSGALSAYVVGFIMTMSSYTFSACLLTFFLISSKATKVRPDMKKRNEADYCEGGQRTWVQVVCNGGIATVFAFLCMLETGCRETAINFGTSYYESSYGCAVLGALACSCGDTLASELGSVMSRGKPRLLTTFREVPRGTNGGVSMAGIVASLLGGLIIGGTYYLMTILCLSNHVIGAIPPQWPTILLGGICGLLGSLIDSYMGAIWQFSGLDRKNRVVNHSGEDITKICGFEVLDNHSVNFISVAITALAAPRIGLFLWSWVVFGF